jgi:hypothetical protein
MKSPDWRDEHDELQSRTKNGTRKLQKKGRSVKMKEEDFAIK